MSVIALDLLLKACKRQLSSTSKPKAPLEPGHIMLITQRLDQSDPINRLFYVALVTQFFTCVRIRNLLPTSTRTFSLFRHLSRGDFNFTNDAIIVTFMDKDLASPR